VTKTGINVVNAILLGAVGVTNLLVLYASRCSRSAVWWLSRAIGRRVDAAEAARGTGTAG
jgi:hypothetical protein